MAEREGQASAPMVESGGVRGAWDERSRIAKFHFVPGCHPNSEDASRIAAKLHGWVGPDRRFNILVDCEGAATTTLAWRVDWARILASQKDRARMALFNVDDDTREKTIDFQRRTHVDIQIFPTEAAAIAWLTGHQDHR